MNLNLQARSDFKVFQDEAYATTTVTTQQSTPRQRNSSPYGQSNTNIFSFSSVKFHQLDFSFTLTNCQLSFSELRNPMVSPNPFSCRDSGQLTCQSRSRAETVHRFPQPNKADFHHAEFSLDTDKPRLFMSANSFCFLRLFFPEHSPSSREGLKKKRKEYSQNSVSQCLSHICKVPRHAALPATVSLHWANDFCGDYLLLCWIFIWAVLFY